jgi:sugar phosphate permease
MEANPQIQKPLSGSSTNVRFLVVGTTALMSVLLYLDRFCISFAEVFIKEDLGLTDLQIGFMMSAFFWTYALGQVPMGWLTDRFGSRIMLVTFVLFWSLFTGLTGLAIGFSMLILLRFGFGFSQSGAYPTGANIVSKWAPFEWRGTASSIISTGGRLGGFLALYGTGYVILWLTPATTPAYLTRADILDAPRLSQELTGQGELEGQADMVAGYVLAEFSESEQVAVDRVASQRNPAAEDIAAVVAGLNRVIGQPEFFSVEILEGLSPEREAVRILAKPPSERTAMQSQRANRLVFEAVHPDCIKKIYGAGWRPMMFAYGSIGLLVAGLIWLLCRDQPRDHPSCNGEEVALINRDPRMSANVSGGVTRVPLKRLLRSRSMWCSCVSQFCTNVGWLFVMTWAPRFFQEVHRVPVETRALMVAIPPLAGMVGMFLGGPLTDFLIGPCGPRWGRALPMSLTRFPAMGAYLVCLMHPSAWTVAVMFAMVSFFTGLGTSSSWAFCQDVGGKQVGSILGWGNMWGNLGAAVAPTLLIFVVGGDKNWDFAFMVCAAAFFLSGIAALGIDATIPIAEIPAEKDPVAKV